MKFDTKKMIELKTNGKTYEEIAKIIGCSPWTVKHHLIPNRKKNQQKYYSKIVKSDPLYIKRKTFLKVGKVIPFSMEELKNKIKLNPFCYLTGQKIDLTKPETYSFDHIIPVSRGGKSSLENLGLVTKEVNMAKYDLTPEEFLNLCKKIVEFGPIR